MAIRALRESGYGALHLPCLQDRPYAALYRTVGPTWVLIDCQRLEPAADLPGAMTTAIERLGGERW
jgi:hypothetical protein